MTNSEKEIEKGNERAGEEIIQVTPSKEKEKEVNKLIFSLNKSQSHPIRFFLCPLMVDSLHLPLFPL